MNYRLSYLLAFALCFAAAFVSYASDAVSPFMTNVYGRDYMLLNGKWNKAGVFNVEEFDPDPFLDALEKYGLPKKESRDPVLVE